MKKTLMIISALLVGMFLLTSFSPISSAIILKSTPSLQDVREHRLLDFQTRVPVPQPSGLYHTYPEMTSLLQTLASTYPSIMSLSSIGKTYEGRDLWMVKLSDNVNMEENEPEVLFMGAHHGNEKPSYEVCLYFLQYMLEHYENTSTPEVQDVIDHTQIYILPMVNPDGVEAGTRKNEVPNHGSFGFSPIVTSHGVDLNRNYGFRWFLIFLLPRFYSGATSAVDFSDVYHGPRPFSENETEAMKQFVDAHNIIISVSYHTYGDSVLYPWGYTFFPPKDEALFVSIGYNITAINHYTLSQSIGLYPSLGDSCDWMYGVHGVLAYTIELGTSYAPTDPQELNDICVTHAAVNLYVCQCAQTL
jgi:carboxypeptidase T